MSLGRPFQGSMFAERFLHDAITSSPGWDGIDDSTLLDLETDLRAVFKSFPTEQLPNEGQTESDLILPILERIGWTSRLLQQNLSVSGRDHVPDVLLLPDEATKDRANGLTQEWKRYGLGLAILESKRWHRPLDRRSGKSGEETAPSTQMLRYLRRVDDLTEGGLRWGLLSNGQQWRLYYQGALSVSEQFFEIDLPAVLDLPGHNQGLFALGGNARQHWLKVFILVFGRDSFLLGTDGQTFHHRAIQEGRYYQQRLTKDLSHLVFKRVFPELAQAIAAAAPDEPLSQVRDAALVLLYRLLFILYAEDRDLLPVRESRYDDYGLRQKVRGDVGRRKDQGDAFSESAARYWSMIDDLCRAIDQGDESIGLPPYNGGLFDRQRTPLLSEIRLGDVVMAKVIDALSFLQTTRGRQYINYRDLGVQQLGSIYERLLEWEVVREDGGVSVRLNAYIRKDTGSYYTPEALVRLIVSETVDPLVSKHIEAFESEVARLDEANLRQDHRSIGKLKRLDPAEKLLELKICDPAMGSGHFLVNLVDHLTDRVIATMADAEAAWEGYVSPLVARIDDIRNTIVANAEGRGWTVEEGQLDDRHIIRRMVLKRCVYGVDKNPMAVELAKVSLWLHTFTVGAPLSFLDHHLRCGDSLFGAWVRKGVNRSEGRDGVLLVQDSVNRATRAASSMQIIENLTDAEIAEAHRSADIFDEVSEMTAPLDALLSLLHAFEWLDLRERSDQAAVLAWLDGAFGDPIDIAQGTPPASTGDVLGERFPLLLETAKQLVDSERFLNWQVAFPGVWSDWKAPGLTGGFDAIIGNPPWDRMKFQQVEWFEARRRKIAMAVRKADRKRMVADLERDNDPLAAEFRVASQRTTSALCMARKGGDYPLLAQGDINLYALFVERAMTLIKPGGMVGLLTPIGIATDKTSSKFFSLLAKEQRVKCFYAFENCRGWLFPDIHHEEQPSVIVFNRDAGAFARFDFCARIRSWEQFDDPQRRFLVDSKAVVRVNPNTGTAPLFRNRRDADLVTQIYERLPVLVDRSSDHEASTWPVKYKCMFHMSNDSEIFRMRGELEEKEGAWPIRGNRYDSSSGEWVPLYEGKSIQLFNHRYANVRVNEANTSGQGKAEPLSSEELRDPSAVPEPRFWVNHSSIPNLGLRWVIGFNDICNTNNARTLIVALVPPVAFGNKLPFFMLSDPADTAPIELLAANLGSIICDYVARQKIQARNLNKYIIEQLPVVPVDLYETTRFGRKTAGEVVREILLELTYTAHDMAAFAEDMGYVDEKGAVLPPFQWDDSRRVELRAKLDAIYFHLYGVTKRDDVRYVYSAFQPMERNELKKYGRYLSLELCLAWMNALAAGNPDVRIDL